MKSHRKYLVAVALLAVVFGLAGTVALVSESVPPQQLSSSSSSSDSVTHFANPPTYDSGWVDIRNKLGQHLTLTHGSNTTEVFVDITGKQSLDPMGGALSWSRTYGGANNDVTFSVVQTSDGRYVLAGYTQSFGAGLHDFWLVKIDSAGNLLWSQTYGGAAFDIARAVVQTSDGGYAVAGETSSSGAGSSDFWLVKTDSAGNLLWSQTYGGAGVDNARSLVQTGDDGYAIAGFTSSFGAGGYDFWLVKTDATGNMLWDQTYGGTSDEFGVSVVQTSDGGYALAGETDSFGAGGRDFWLVKTDSAGNTLWNQTYGGASTDQASSVVQTFDGGYAIAGQTQSFGVGGQDFWLVKTDSAGTMLWSQTYGGASHDYGRSLVQAGNGGYTLAGHTSSFGAGSTDCWLVKTDADGMALSNQTYGGTSIDDGLSVVQTSDGGYAIAGDTQSSGAGGYDFWLVKVNVDTNLEHQRNLNDIDYKRGWSETYGGANGDQPWSVVQTSDGGYAIAGDTYSFSVGQNDFWLVKTDSSGNMQWDQNYGGLSYDTATSVVQTFDGGYALAGHTQSSGAGFTDFWLVKTDEDGTFQWSRTYGGTSDDVAMSLVQTFDGGYALAGHTWSFGAGGSYDFWLVKTDSAGTMLWSQTYGGTSNEFGKSLVQTSDGGYAIAGEAWSSGDVSYVFWLVKTDSAGNMLWSETYGGTSDDYATSVVQTFDGGYALAGYTQSFGAGLDDFWLVKTDASGNQQWDQTYGGANEDRAFSMVQTSGGGYALAGYTGSFGAGGADFWLVKTDSAGTMLWSQTYGGANADCAFSVVQTCDSGYALTGYTFSTGKGGQDFWLVKTDVETGLVWTGLTNYTIILYRGRTDPYWNYVRVRIWLIKEPTWQFGDINQDGIVDAKDLAIIGKNYGKTFSALSLGGIVAIAGIYAYKKRKRPK